MSDNSVHVYISNNDKDSRRIVSVWTGVEREGNSFAANKARTDDPIDHVSLSLSDVINSCGSIENLTLEIVDRLNPALAEH